MSDTSYDMLKTAGVQQTIIDTAAFSLINYGGHEITKYVPKMEVSKGVIFALSDLAIRNGYLKMGKQLFKAESPTFGGNLYIATSSFVFAGIYDLIVGKEFSKAFLDNLVRNALGLAGNEVVDKLIPQSYN